MSVEFVEQEKGTLPLALEVLIDNGFRLNLDSGGRRINKTYQPMLAVDVTFGDKQYFFISPGDYIHRLDLFREKELDESQTLWCRKKVESIRFGDVTDFQFNDYRDHPRIWVRTQQVLPFSLEYVYEKMQGENKVILVPFKEYRDYLDARERFFGAFQEE